MRKFIDIRSPSLFQSDYIQLQSVVSSITFWKHSVQVVPSSKKKKKKNKKTSSGRKKENEMEINGRRPERWESRKRKQKKERAEEGGKEERGEEEKKEKRKEEEKEKERKEVEKRRRRKGMEGVCAEGKGRGRTRSGKKRKKEGEGEERREREREKENRENGARGALSSPDAFPSTKLGNNMTPIKGRLGKNTTPTSRSLTELNQTLQNNPQQRRLDFDASSRTNFSYAPEGSKYKFYSKEATIYKKAKTLGNLCKRLKFSINQH